MKTRPTAMEAILADPARAGLVLDFDGVLSPIVEDPDTSILPDHVAAILARLVDSVGLVAIMSGRPVEFLASRVHIPGIRLLGSHGVEQVDSDGRRFVDQQAEPWLDKVIEAEQILDAKLSGLPGVKIEPKSVSVAVHWRQAPDHDLAAKEVRRVVSQAAEATGLRLEPGKLMEELRPPIDVDKGSAITELLTAAELLNAADPRPIVYAGDDLGDIPALEVVIQQPRGYALVVDHGSETDAQLLALADQTYAGSDAFADWLGELADGLAS